MSLIVNRYRDKKLNKLNINIKTKYKCGDKTLEVYSDKKNPDIDKGVILEKDYYRDGYLLKKIYNFDPRIEYSFINPKLYKYTCPNCGYTYNPQKYDDGCPYCGTYFNLDYTFKELSDKSHYDYILNSNKYRVITYIVDLVITFICVFIYMKSTSRTFNSLDIAKILFFTALISTILYYVFYMLDARIVLGPIKNYKNKINEHNREFWENEDINKTEFFNNFIYELNRVFYTDESSDIIDYDIVDYNSFSKENIDGKIYIKVNVNIRLVKFDKKIKVEVINREFRLVKIEKKEKNGNIIQCHNCGASIDVLKHTCPYCGTEYNYLQDWYIV